MDKRKLQKSIEDSMGRLGIKSISMGKKKLTMNTDSNLSRLVVGGIDGHPVTIHVGDQIEVINVRIKNEEVAIPYAGWEPSCAGEIAGITKDSFYGLYHVLLKSGNSYITSNRKCGWYRLFHVVKKKGKTK